MQCDNGENGDNGDLQTETAWGGDTAGGGAAWWYYYDPDIGGEQTIWAGQDHDAGTVEVVDGTIHITLLNGWELQDDSESVKIQGYNEIPDSRPPAGSFLLPELLFLVLLHYSGTNNFQFLWIT